MYYIILYRNTLNVRLLQARALNDGGAIRELYVYLRGLEVCEASKARLGSARQALVDLDRSTWLAHLLQVLSQVRTNTFRQKEVTPGGNLFHIR